MHTATPLLISHHSGAKPLCHRILLLTGRETEGREISKGIAYTNVGDLWRLPLTPARTHTHAAIVSTFLTCAKMVILLGCKELLRARSRSRSRDAPSLIFLWATCCRSFSTTTAVLAHGCKNPAIRCHLVLRAPAAFPRYRQHFQVPLQSVQTVVYQRPRVAETKGMVALLATAGTDDAGFE